jgi:hypothetical protein
LVQHKDLSSGSRYLWLQTTAAEANNNAYFRDFPTASVFKIGTSTGVNYLNYTYIAYCFHSVEGYSKIGLYKGNGNPDGTFVYTGFRPAYVMMKRSDSASSGHWLVKDSKRDEFNSNTLYHQVNENYVEADNTVEIDYLSNGFKQRSSNNINNANNSSYIYIAFAETPFKHANAR